MQKNPYKQYNSTRIFAKQLNKIKIKNGHFSFFDILQLPHTVISHSDKLTHPNAHVQWPEPNKVC